MTIFYLFQSRIRPRQLIDVSLNFPQLLLYEIKVAWRRFSLSFCSCLSVSPTTFGTFSHERCGNDRWD